MVFTDLERGAVAVVKSMGRESSKTIGHKYGEDAGKVADDSMTAAAHGINLAYVRILLHIHNNSLFTSSWKFSLDKNFTKPSYLNFHQRSKGRHIFYCSYA